MSYTKINMHHNKKIHPKEKVNLHPRSKHKERYDFNALIKMNPLLKAHLVLNEYGDESIDFSNADAVKVLNSSLLAYYYQMEYWDIPLGYLCPPVPGRADYIHNVADLLADNNEGVIPLGPKVRCLDIGVGANCIYPIIGVSEYNWTFVGSDIYTESLNSASLIVLKNQKLKNKVNLILQKDSNKIFEGIVMESEYFDLTICNPPFHASKQDAENGTLRKLRNLKKSRVDRAVKNFGGKSNELWCDGGEETFVKKMVLESIICATQILWFTTLISKEMSLKSIYASLDDAKANRVVTLPMSQGNKVSRVVAWTYHTDDQIHNWAKLRWK